MRAILLVASLVLAPAAATAAEDTRVFEPAHIGRSLAAVAVGAVAFVGVLGGAALVGGALTGVLAPRSPSFFPPAVRDGPLGTPASILVSAVVGAALAAPLALLCGMAVDAVAWLAILHPTAVRPILVMLGGALVSVAVTLPTLVAACVLMALVAVASRQDADRLATQPDRALVIAALGWAWPLVCLVVPVALAGAALRGTLQAAIAPG